MSRLAPLARHDSEIRSDDRENSLGMSWERTVAMNGTGQTKCQSHRTDILSCYFTENLYTQLCVYVSPGLRRVDGKWL